MENKEVRKYIRYDDAAQYFGIGKTKFIELAKELKATRKIGKMVLVNCRIIEDYIESCRD